MIPGRFPYLEHDQDQDQDQEAYLAGLEGRPWVTSRGPRPAYHRGLVLRPQYEAFLAGLAGKPFVSSAPLCEACRLTQGWLLGCRVRRASPRPLHPLEAFERALATGELSPPEL